MTDAAAAQVPVVAVDAANGPSYCPNPAMPLWSSHPRIYLHFADDGEARCPYCGTRYRLVGARAAAH